MSECTTEAISTLITELKNGKASDIPIHVIALYNRYMNEGIFPDELKVGKISPIYKKVSEELLENYRPVSTLAIFGKIFEKVMFARLHKTCYMKINMDFENTTLQAMQ